MKKSTAIFVALIVLGLSSCATDYAKKAPAEISQQIKVIDSEFDKSRLFAAPPVQKSPMFGVNYTARLVASQDKSNGGIVNIINVSWDYSGTDWFLFHSADITGAQPLITHINDRKVKHCSAGAVTICSYSESLSAVVPLESLSNAANGLKIRFNSNKGGVVIELPVNYVLGYLQGVALLAKQ